MKPRRTLSLVALLLYAFLYAPICVVVLISFNSAHFGTEWKGFTTHWYAVLASDANARAAIKNTLILAGVSTSIATLLGTMLGYGLNRYHFRGRGIINSILQVPVFIPDVVMAVSLLLFYGLLRNWTGYFGLGMITMVLAHVTFQIPFVAIVVRARLNGLDPALEEAAHDLGATGRQTFWHVTLPLMFPGILAGAMMAFTLSLDDFVVSFFTTGPGSTTLPILIYSSLKRGLTPEIHALSTLIIVASVMGALMVGRFQRQSRS